MADGDEIALSFHDSLLRLSDLRLLEGPRWLNDKIIGFAFEYLEREQFCDFSDDVCFISPEVTQFIKLSPASDLGIFLEPLNLHNKKFIFLAVNDNESCDSVGGSHWSLLVFDRNKGQFEHYDSASHGNSRIASSLSNKLSTFIKVGPEVKCVDMDCSQQQNSYDCGLFVICNTECLCAQLLRGSQVSVKQAVTQDTVSRKRDQLRTLIVSLGNRGKEKS